MKATDYCLMKIGKTPYFVLCGSFCLRPDRHNRTEGLVYYTLSLILLSILSQANKLLFFTPSEVKRSRISWLILFDLIWSGIVFTTWECCGKVFLTSLSMNALSFYKKRKIEKIKKWKKKPGSHMSRQAENWFMIPIPTSTDIESRTFYYSLRSRMIKTLLLGYIHPIPCYNREWYRNQKNTYVYKTYPDLKPRITAFFQEKEQNHFEGSSEPARPHGKWFTENWYIFEIECTFSWPHALCQANNELSLMEKLLKILQSMTIEMRNKRRNRLKN